MLVQDEVGLPLTGASVAAAEHYAKARHEIRCLIGDPIATLDAALRESPAFAMAHVLRAYMVLLGTESSGAEVGRAALAAVEGVAVDARERGHLAALRALVDGRMRDATRLLEDVAIDHPHDGVALQVGHQFDLIAGQTRMLRDRIARALPHWSERMPGYHALLSAHGFGLEECGDYARGEAQARRALELESRDGWAWHAVAHVMEMQDRRKEGVAFLGSIQEIWARESFFAVHNAWHLALFHLDQGETERVLELFDGPIYGTRSPIVFDLLDASALLWRLHLLGIDVGDRWRAVADGWMPHARAGISAFSDAHALMAFVGAERTEAAEAVLDTQVAAYARDDDYGDALRGAGHAIAQSIAAFGRADYHGCVEWLRPVRSQSARIGGSHAQRDLVDRTLLEAAFRAGDARLADALEAERIALRPENGVARSRAFRRAVA
jgi:hypothetical protein